jgi:hypothetical protein
MSIIYTTGITPDGARLIGGVWTLWHQEGLPLEVSHLNCKQEGWAVDWMEAMADASLTDNLPALVDAITAFLPAEELQAIKARFGCLCQQYTPEQIMASKKPKAAIS